MFGKKLIVAAAAVALALGHVAAVDQASHIKVQVAHASYKTHHNTITHAHHKQADANTTTAPAPTTAPEEEDDDEGSGDSDSVEEETEEEEEEKEETEEDGSEEDGSEEDGSQEDGSEEDDDETEETDGSADVEIDIVIEGNSTTTTDTTETTEEEVSLCLPGWTEVSVEGVDDIFCAKGQICVADIKDGSCPSPQHALPLGAYCDIVKTGVYGCKPVTEDMITEEEDSPYKPVCVGKDESPMSVEGVEGVFCVSGQACVADINDGACPVAQEGLEFGAYCDKVKTGVYGCKPKTKEMAEETEETDEDEEEDEDEGSDKDEGDDEEETVVDVTVCSGKDQSPMSVEGVEGVFCVTGQACVADIKDGACPDAQEGLEFGSYCGTVKTGVYGCKPKTKDMYENEQVPEEEEGSDDSEEEEEVTTAAPTTAPAVPAPAPVCSGPGQSPMSVEGVEGVFCVTGQACVANIDGACPDKQEGLPFGSYCGTVQTGVKGCKPNSSKHQMKKHAKAAKAAVCSGPGQSPMSVEGVEGVFCVTGQACVADIKSGACPSQQAGLPWGAYCDKVKTGVYGCKPQTEEMWKAQHQQSGSNGLCTGPGQSPMSVEGVQGVFCVTGQACVANIDGACPGKQAGLPFGSYCGTVQTGVKGCKPNSGKHHKGHKIKVTKVSAKKIHHKKH